LSSFDRDFAFCKIRSSIGFVLFIFIFWVRARFSVCVLCKNIFGAWYSPENFERPSQVKASLGIHSTEIVSSSEWSSRQG